MTVVAVPVTETLQVLRNAPMRQSLQSNPPEQSYNGALESQLDQMTMAAQDSERRAQDDTSRSLRVPANEVVPDLPPHSDRANSILGFDVLGVPVTVSIPLLTDAAAVQAAVIATANSASSASDSADTAGSAAASASAFASASASSSASSASSAAAAALSAIPQGPFTDAPTAIAAGVKVGSTYFQPDFRTFVARYKAARVALFGDSITNFNSFYRNGIKITDVSGYGLVYNIRAVVPNPATISVTHLNPGGTGSLSIAWSGNNLIVTLEAV
jgi:hypothetical protein